MQRMSHILSLQLCSVLLALLTLLTLGFVVMEWICIFLSVCRGSGGSHWSRYGILTSVALVVASMQSVCSDICFVFDSCSFCCLFCSFYLSIDTLSHSWHQWPDNSGPELAWVDFCWCLFKSLLLPPRLFCWTTSRGQSKRIVQCCFLTVSWCLFRFCCATDEAAAYFIFFCAVWWFWFVIYHSLVSVSIMHSHFCHCSALASALLSTDPISVGIICPVLKPDELGLCRWTGEGHKMSTPRTLWRVDFTCPAG